MVIEQPEESSAKVVDDVELDDDEYDNVYTDMDEGETNDEDWTVDSCDDYNCEDCYPNCYEPPSKGDLITMVATAFWQVTMPMLVFNAVEQKAYRDYYGDYEPDEYYLDTETAEFKTKEMELWDKIQGLNILHWGPTLILGGFALSGNLQEPAALWIENMVSNLYIPVMIEGWLNGE